MSALRGSRRRAGVVFAMLSDWLEAELQERRGFLWLAVFFGIGPLIYFALPREPEPLASAILLAILLLLAFIGRERAGVWRTALCGLAIVAGFGGAQFRVASLSTPQIESPFAAEVEGRVSRRRSASNEGRASYSIPSGSVLGNARSRAGYVSHWRRGRNCRPSGRGSG